MGEVYGRRRTRRRRRDETQTGWPDARRENRYHVTLFSLHHSHLSPRAGLAFSPLQEESVNNLNFNALFCFLSACSQASQTTEQATEKPANTPPPPHQTYNGGVFRNSTALLLLPPGAAGTPE